MSRTLKIAVREYLSYIRTVGFWLSMCVMPLGFAVAFLAPGVVERSAPVPRLAVVDLTGRDYVSAVADALKTPLRARGSGVLKPAAVLVPAPIPTPHSAQQAARLLGAVRCGDRGRDKDRGGFQNA